MKRIVFISVCLLALLGLSSWGFLVHRTVNQLAIYQLPKDLAVFFYSNKDYLVKNSVRPDERRNTDSSEATRHFIDFEFYGDKAAWTMPKDWKSAEKKYSKDSLEKYGHLPYVIIAVQQKLTNAFRQKNKDSILFYAADLGHYIGDAHVPLHTTINYDGQLTNQKGLHSLWESMIPELELAQYDLATKHEARYLKNPETQIWKTLQHSFVLTKDVFNLEKEVTKDFTADKKYRVQMRRGKEVRSYTTDFAKAYSNRLKPTVNQQLKASAELLADFWYTAWVNAGRPNLASLSQQKEQQKESFKQEKKLFRSNKLLANKKLLARTNQSTEE